MDRIPGKPAQRVATALREAIRSGELLPGEHIRQAVWADQLNVSRLPIREALSTLAADGTVEHDPNRGYFVARRATEEIAQLYLLRELIEPEVIRTIAWPDDATIAHLEQHRDRAVQALHARDARAAIDHDRAFCWTIWDLSPLNIVVAEAKRLWHQCDPHRASTFTDPVFVTAIVGDYQARFDTYLRLLATRDRDGLATYVLQERRTMVEFLNHGSTNHIGTHERGSLLEL